MRHFTHISLLSSTAFWILSSTALADDEGTKICVVQEPLISKLALYGIPLLVTIGLGYLLSNSWGNSAVDKGRKASGEIMAGWAGGLFLGALSFTGLLYAVSELKLEEENKVLSTASCYPDGWGIIAGVLCIVTLIIFVIVKLNAKK